MSEPSRRGNLQSFLRTMAAHGRRGGFVRAGAARRREASYEETLDLAGGVAAVLRDGGVERGDRVLLVLDDGPEWVAAFAGCLALGAVAVPLEPGSPGAFFEGVASRCRAKALVHDARGRSRPFAGLRLDATTVGRRGADLLEPVASPARSDLAEIVFTSGTTAAPRGVMITHGNLLGALAGIERGILARRRLYGPVSPLVFVSLVPLSHLFGQALGVFIPSIMGARVVFTPSRPPRALLGLARREKACVMVLVPRHLAGIREHASSALGAVPAPPSTPWWIAARRSLPLVRAHGWRLRAFVVGGARLDPDLEAFFRGLGYFVVQGYGLTETAPIVSVSNPFDRRVGLLGRPTRAQEVRIAPDGEILVRGENVSPGYYEDAEATSAALQDGWLRTGDLGALEPDGSLRFLGRKKEIIVTGEGQNVFPEEVEAALRSQEGIADGAVVAVPGERGEEVHAALIPAPRAGGGGGAAGPGGGPGVTDEILAAAVAAANERLAPHQRVRGWSIWNDMDFPRTGTGKVMRREVASAVRARLAACGAAAGSAAAPTGSLGAEVEGPLSRLRALAGPGAAPDRRLGAELGLSSLDVAELAAEIEERYQVELAPEMIHEDASLQALLDHARSRSGPEARWPMPRWARTPPARIVRGLLQDLVAWPLLRVFVRLRAEGRDRLRALCGPVIVAASHASHFDVPVLLVSMPRRLRRRTAVAMQPEYFEPYLKGEGRLLTRLHMGWHYKLTSLLLHTFPFPRSAAFRVALEYAGDLVDRGWSILVFPEGELSRDGAVHAFRPGIGVLARELGLPVVPARIEGAFDVIPRGTKFPRKIRWPVRVAWGSALAIGAEEDPASFAARVEAAVRSL